MDPETYKRCANLIRSTEVYDVYDLPMQNLVLSMTELHPGQETKGHSHPEEEVYFFTQGHGKMQIGELIADCFKGDTFIIPSGEFHKVFNKEEDASEDLRFYAVFQKYGDRGIASIVASA